ncbi:alpha/beta hydrolase [Streptomyces poriferorum]|uniref:Alpha/beta hydrolase n=1 Tax=Streptomyces poriferorum TaxID=2798799 RepID=A0ABY9IWH7_9ACTN|nr:MULTISPECIES: alpha/beta hydrolase [Streptomyces]MBW5250595.1 alpha/beta hydrolase [Streptomyces poriferorum]MBW5255709.1 alpha/beta hydrolase [Streptomyces poriferorum]MDP5312579.1 alpha/beta hydrolase [Streptomyces sp. Alt4]WLQ48932.1 alpha/beta hydrolase [Streptomyces sp. Alt1]WLQ58392.1 alpha/beta hydrolase [Streptomyces sp. Alt2]
MDPATAVVGAALSDRGEEVFDLFRRPKGRSRTRPDERAAIESARTSELTVNGKVAVVYRWGSGERPVLLVHGWESRASRYAKAVARLLELGYSPVSFDAPGHGEATGDSTTLLEYRDIITELHRVHGDFEAVVAHSFGVTATFFSLRHGVRAGRIVAISTVPDFTYLVDAFSTGMGLEPHLKEELRGRIERDVYPGEADMWTRFSVFHEAASVRIPLLVIHDEEDGMVDAGQGRRVAEAFGARLVTTRRFGHRRILGAPQVVDEIANFMTSDVTEAGRKTEVATG